MFPSPNNCTGVLTRACLRVCIRFSYVHTHPIHTDRMRRPSTMCARAEKATERVLRRHGVTRRLVGEFFWLVDLFAFDWKGTPPPPLPPLRKLRGNISHFIVLVISCENVFECVWRMRKDSWSTHSHWCKELQVLYNFQSYSMQINTTLIWWENPLF